MNFLVPGRTPLRVKVSPPATVESVLTAVGWHLRSEESVFVANARRPLDFRVKTGDVLIISFPIRGEASVKCRGDIWRVHKSDPDKCFPSDFHAHNQNGRPEILDLYTGLIFDARTRRPVRRISKSGFEQVLKAFAGSKEVGIRDNSRRILLPNHRASADARTKEGR